MKKNKLFGPLIILLVWWIFSVLGNSSSLLLPSPSDVFYSLKEIIFLDENFIKDILYTLHRAITSFLISIIIGVPVGIFMGVNKNIYNIFEIVVDFFRSIPAIALFPLFILFFGIGEISKIAVAFYAGVLVIIINTIYGVRNSSKLRTNIGKIYNFSKWKIITKITLPDSLPHIFSGMRIALSLSLVLIIVVEMITGSDTGLGARIYDYHLVFEIEKMYAAIIITGLIGYLLNIIFMFIEKKFLFWIYNKK